jgi:alpha-1,2-mannosyltransferase
MKASQLFIASTIFKPYLVFNFWEPLHYLHRGYGFQTWETSPVYAIRSYAYIVLHLLPAKITVLLGPEKVSF